MNDQKSFLWIMAECPIIIVWTLADPKMPWRNLADWCGAGQCTVNINLVISVSKNQKYFKREVFFSIPLTPFAHTWCQSRLLFTHCYRMQVINLQTRVIKCLIIKQYWPRLITSKNIGKSPKHMYMWTKMHAKTIDKSFNSEVGKFCTRLFLFEV